AGRAAADDVRPDVGRHDQLQPRVGQPHAVRPAAEVDHAIHRCRLLHLDPYGSTVAVSPPDDLTDFSPPPRLAAADFVIRCYLPGDGPRVAEAVTASYDHLKTYMPWARPRQGVRTSARLVTGFRRRYLAGEDFILGIFEPEGGRMLGGTGYHL